MPDDPGAPEVTDEEATAAPGPELEPEEEAVVEGNELDPDAVPVTDPVAEAEAALAERTEDLQRLTAEYTNYRRRTDRERTAAIEGAKAAVVAELLPILDDLELAAQHGDLEGPFKAYAEKLQSTVAGLGVTGFGEPGEEFNHDIHEAVQDISTGDDKAIGTVLRRGYRIGDRVIRTAMVVIDDAPAEDAADGDNA